MRPRRISDGSAFDPGVLRVVQSAFDQAWLLIGGRFSAEEAESAREQLAEAVMNGARENSTDVNMLRDASVRMMALHYPAHFGDTEAGHDTKIG